MWKGYITLRGANNKTVNMAFNLVVDAILPADQFAQARNALEAIRDDLALVTDATVAGLRVSFEFDQSNALGAGDLFEKAAVVVHIEPTGEAEKFHTLYIPAPAIGIFLAESGSGRDVVDVADAGLGSFVNAVSENATVSDGETINTDAGTGGVEAGRRITVRGNLAA